MKLRRKRLVVRAVLVGLVLWGFMFLFGGCASRLVLRPPGGVIDPGGARREFVLSGGRKIEVYVARSAAAQTREPRAYVLEFTGNATRAEEIAQYVAQRWDRYPVEAWVMNYPGYGGSDGPKSFGRMPAAALAAYDALRATAGDRPIFVEANSLGTASAMLVAAKRPVAGCILQNPPPLRQLLLSHYGWWNLWLAALPAAFEIPRDLDSIANARNVKSPGVFLLADRDEVVPPRYQRMVVDSYAGEKHAIPLVGAGHNNPVTGDAQRKLQEEIDWLWKRAID